MRQDLLVTQQRFLSSVCACPIATEFFCRAYSVRSSAPALCCCVGRDCDMGTSSHGQALSRHKIFYHNTGWPNSDRNMKNAMSRHKSSWLVQVLSRQRNICYDRTPWQSARVCCARPRPPVARVPRPYRAYHDTSRLAMSRHRGPCRDMEPKNICHDREFSVMTGTRK